MFLSSAKVRGRDTTLELRTKQAILTACTYSGSGNKIELEMIREALAVSTNSFYHKTITRTNKLDAYKPVGPSHRQTKWTYYREDAYETSVTQMIVLQLTRTLAR